MSRQIIDLTEKRFGKLLVKQFIGLVPVGKQKGSAFLCICDCGRQVTVLGNNLKRGNTSSCGCLQRQSVRKIKVNLTNEKFGNLEVVSIAYVKNGNSYWNCKCMICGKTAPIAMSAIKKGQKSCGCRQGWWRSSKPGLWKNPAAYAKWKRKNPINKLHHSVSCSIRSMLKRNGSYKRKKSILNYLPYSIEELKNHIERLWEPWMNWNNYGGKSNDERRTWHIDHIKPHHLFPYKSMNDVLFRECWSMSNLRPLEKKQNMKKGGKFSAIKEG